MLNPDRKLASIKLILQEEGAAALLARGWRFAVHRMRDRLIASHMGCPPIRLGRMPKVFGRRHIVIGANFQAGDNLWLEAVTHYRGIVYDPKIQIGDNVGVSDSVHIACTSQVVLGEGTLIGSRVLITDHNHGLYEGSDQSSALMPPSLRPLSRNRRVVVGCNVWIGDGVAVLAGAVIGEGSIIGANSVVVGAIPAFCIAAGQPARPIRYYNPEIELWVKSPNE